MTVDSFHEQEQLERQARELLDSEDTPSDRQTPTLPQGLSRKIARPFPVERATPKEGRPFVTRDGRRRSACHLPR